MMARKTRIRPPRPEPPVNVNEAWSQVLEPVVIQTLRGTTKEDTPETALAYGKLYHSVYQLVSQGNLNFLHKKLREAISQCLRVKYANTTANDLVAVFNDHNKCMKKIGDIFLYADKNATVPYTQIISNSEFRTNFVEPNFSALISALSNECHKLRDVKDLTNQTTVDPEYLTQSIALLDVLSTQIVETNLENLKAKFLKSLVSDSKQYFVERFEKLSSDSLERMETLRGWQLRETYMSKLYGPDVAAELTKFIGDLTAKNLTLILNDPSGMRSWTRTNNNVAVKLAYELDSFARTKFVDPHLSHCITEDQNAVNSQFGSDPIDFVVNTNVLIEKYRPIIKHSNTESCITAHRNAISSFKESITLVATFLDLYLKKKSPVSVENPLEMANNIYKLLKDSDAFVDVYRKQLARRLINKKYRSLDEEKEFAILLGEHSNGIGMMIDNIETSKRMFHGAETFLDGIIPTDVDVLGSLLWPKQLMPQSDYEPVFPDKIADAKMKFARHYHNIQDSERKLTWNYNQSTADVEINVDSGTYMANAPLLSVTILNLFGGNEVYTTEQISELTNIPLGGELERHLLSICCPSCDLLVKDPPSQNVLVTDKFSFNTKFSSPKYRIKVTPFRFKSTAKPKTKELDAEMLKQEQSEKIRAIIVMIMKSKRQMLHTKLVGHTANLIKPQFTPTLLALRKEIEYLLHMKYIERDPDNRELYHYIP